jgi:hypothetical protein
MDIAHLLRRSKSKINPQQLGRSLKAPAFNFKSMTMKPFSFKGYEKKLFKDSDKDGYFNAIDCKPFNKKKQDLYNVKVYEDEKKVVWQNPFGKQIRVEKASHNVPMPSKEDVSYFYDQLPSAYHHPKTEVALLSKETGAMEYAKKLSKGSLLKEKYTDVEGEERVKKIYEEQTYPSVWTTEASRGWEIPEGENLIHEKSKAIITLYPSGTKELTKEGMEASMNKFKKLSSSKKFNYKYDEHPKEFSVIKADLMHETGHDVIQRKPELEQEWEYGNNEAGYFVNATTRYGATSSTEGFAEDFSTWHGMPTRNLLQPLQPANKQFLETGFGGMKKQKSSREEYEENISPKHFINEGITAARERELQEYNVKGYEDTDGDGIINSEDCCPKDPTMQDKGQCPECKSLNTNPYVFTDEEIAYKCYNCGNQFTEKKKPKSIKKQIKENIINEWEGYVKSGSAKAMPSEDWINSAVKHRANLEYKYRQYGGKRKPNVLKTIGEQEKAIIKDNSNETLDIEESDMPGVEEFEETELKEDYNIEEDDAK